MADNAMFLITSSMKFIEYDEDDDIQVEIEKEKTNEEQYESMILIDSIGRYNFKEVYNDSINFIKSMDLEKQKTLCLTALSKIENIYEISFIKNVDLNTKEDVNDFYLFLEFIEFNHIEFVSNIWINLNKDIGKINIKEYCDLNSNLIIREIDKEVENSFLPEIINEFLRTNIKSVIINLFIKMTERSKTEVRIFIEGGIE